MEITGQVDSVRIIAGEPWLVLSRPDGTEEMLRAGDVQMAEDDSLLLTLNLLAHINTNINTSHSINQTLAMVGRHVQAITLDSRGRPTGFVEGLVEFIDFTGPFPTLAIGNQRVHAGEVVGVGSRNMIIGQHLGIFYNGNMYGGIVEGININEGNPYAVIGGVEHRIDHVNFLTEAFNLRRDATVVEHNGYPAVVTNVHTRNGTVWIGLQHLNEYGQPYGPVSNVPYATFVNQGPSAQSVIGHYVGFYNNEVFNQRGRIESVNLSAISPSVVINGTTHNVDSLDFLLQAINLREDGTIVRHDGEDVRVVGVSIRNGMVRVLLQTQEEEGRRTINITFASADFSRADDDDGDND
jgi:hypothetical protein